MLSVQTKSWHVEILTISNKRRNGLSFWPRGRLEETVRQFIPAEGGENRVSCSRPYWRVSLYSKTNVIHRYIPVLVDILDLIDLLLNALTGDAIGLQLIDLLVNKIRGGFVEVLQEVLDDLRDDVVGLLLVLSLVGQVCLWIACKVIEEEEMRAAIAVGRNTNKQSA